MRPKTLFSVLPAAAGMILLVVSLSLVVLKSTQYGAGFSENLRAKAAHSDVVLSLSPRKQTYNFSPSTFFTEGVVVDSAGKTVNAVDAVIFYDPEQVYVDPQVAVGTLLEHYPIARVDPKEGKIIISAINFSAKPALGIFATFRYKALRTGLAKFTFDFKPGEKLDSNVVDHDTDSDVLTKVENAEVVFQ